MALEDRQGAARGKAPPEKPLPSNLAIEQQLLGAILVNSDAFGVVAHFLRPEHFFEAVHRAIFEVAGQMVAIGKRVTPGTIRTFLPADLKIGELSLQQYLARLAAEATTIVNVEGWGKTVAELWLRREAISLGEGVADDARLTEGEVSALPMLDRVAERVFELKEEADRLSGGARESPVDFGAVVEAAEARMAETGPTIRGVSTHLIDLDHRLAGMAGGDFIVLAGRPGMGKSVLGVCLADTAALHGEGVGYDSLEMTGPQLRSRMLADMCERGGHPVTYKAIDRTKIGEADVAPLRRAGDKLDAMPLVLFAEGRNRIDELPEKIRQAKKKLANVGVALSLFVVDYLGLYRPTDRYKGSKVNEVGEISSVLKNLALRENIAILALHQLNRENEKRKDRRPTLADLRDSGNLEQDADTVMFVYREAYYHERPGYTDETEAERVEHLERNAHTLEIIIAKQRQGGVGTAKVYCDVALNAVRDMPRGYGY